MLSTTFLGHQGWLFQSKAASFLVDPLLCEEFGQAQALEYRMYPPRVFTFESFPRIDGLVLTHEHDDHFDIPSLARIERSIPIYLSSRSSTSARQILHEMGFTVHPLLPGEKVQFGDLELTPFCGDHVRINSSDEWDTLPFFVRHLGGSGNFFSMVDITLTEQHLQWARARDSRPVVVAWTNNALDWSHMTDFLEQKNATQDCFIKMGVDHKLITSNWGTPAAILMVAGGFTFDGERASVDNAVVCQQMSRLYPKEQFHVTRPGQTFLMEGHRLKRVLDDAPFLTTAPPETWPRAVPRKTALGQLLFTTMHPPRAAARWRTATTNYSSNDCKSSPGRLWGARFSKACYSILHDQATGRIPTFALAVRTGDERRVYEYVPTACAFVRGTENPEETYLAGMECWGSDLLAILGGDLGPIALNFGRARLWNALPERFFFDLFAEFHRMSHPLRRPSEYLRTYRRLWATSANVAPVIFRR